MTKPDAWNDNQNDDMIVLSNKKLYRRHEFEGGIVEWSALDDIDDEDAVLTPAGEPDDPDPA
ncbi:MAG: hypothetical protein QGH60_13530 [Phycisphaerae bacterium]|jgi:hypothetical protein|nr:hypothetical protein [Phycisphaerae bacterium]